MSKTTMAGLAGSGRPSGEKAIERPVRTIYPIRAEDGVAWMIATRLGSQEVEFDEVLADYGSQGKTITRLEVLGWMRFRNSHWPEPAHDDEKVQLLVDACNLIRVTEPAQDALPSEAQDRMSRVKEALNVLGAELPGMMRAFTRTSALCRSRPDPSGWLCALCGARPHR